MGLISSIRSDDYAYRLYDQNAIQRLEQILILRKLNISIRDIQRIFNDSGSSVVLKVLEEKVQGIDDEVALLHELKEIILDFIKEIEQVNFEDNSDIKQLYDKAKEIETQLVSVDYIGKPANVSRLVEITEKLDKQIPDVMIVRVPTFKAVSTGLMSWEDMMINGGCDPLWNNTHLYRESNFGFSDFLIRKDGQFEWIQALKDDIDISAMDLSPLKVYDFAGGLYAVAVCIDSDMESLGKVEKKIFRWIETTNFVYDESRGVMGAMSYNDDDIRKGLGYAQLQRYVPIKLKEGL